MPLPSFLRWLTTSPPTTSTSSATEYEQRIAEQINPTAIASSPTQEDWYWGRLATGGEEDYYWRRLSDNWYMKDVIPFKYLRNKSLHECLMRHTLLLFRRKAFR